MTIFVDNPCPCLNTSRYELSVGAERSCVSVVYGASGDSNAFVCVHRRLCGGRLLVACVQRQCAGARTSDTRPCRRWLDAAAAGRRRCARPEKGRAEEEDRQGKTTGRGTRQRTATGNARHGERHAGRFRVQEPGEQLCAKTSAAATKTDTSILETPQSISVVTREQLDTRDVKTMVEALQYVPGIYTHPGGKDPRFDQYQIRGFDAQATGPSATA